MARHGASVAQLQPCVASRAVLKDVKRRGYEAPVGPPRLWRSSRWRSEPPCRFGRTSYCVLRAEAASRLRARRQANGAR